MRKIVQAIFEILGLLEHQKVVKNSNENITLKGKGGWEMDNQAIGDTPAARKARQSA